MLLIASCKHIIILSFNIPLFRQFVQASPFLHCWMLVLVPIFAVKIYVLVHILLYNFGSHLWISPEGKVFCVQWMHGSQRFFKSTWYGCQMVLGDPDTESPHWRVSSRLSVACVAKRLCKSHLRVCLCCSFNLQGIHCRDRLVLGPTFSGSDRNPPSRQWRNQVPARPRVICAQQPCTGRRPRQWPRVQTELLWPESEPAPWWEAEEFSCGAWSPREGPLVSTWSVFTPRNPRLALHPLEAGVPWTPVHRLRTVPGSPEHRVPLVPHLSTPLGARPHWLLHPGGWSQSLFHGSFKRKTRRMLPFHLLNDLIPKGLGHHGISVAWFLGHF